MSEQRLQKILAQAGFGSRRACEELITAGRVTVDGRVVTELGAKADPAVSDIRVDGRPVSAERLRYIMLHKPAGYLSGEDPRAEYPSCLELVHVPERLFVVGRLDQDSEGLLLLTNDGELTNRLTHPRYEHPKTYLVQVERIPDARKIRRLQHGVMLDDGPTAPTRVTLLRQPPTVVEGKREGAEGQGRRGAGVTAWLRVTMREGRKRQLRRMVALLGHPALRVIRIGLGPLKLGDLKPGQWRDLTPGEVKALRQAAWPDAADAGDVTQSAGLPKERDDVTQSAGLPKERDEVKALRQAAWPDAADAGDVTQSAGLPRERDRTSSTQSGGLRHARPSTIAIDGPAASGKSTIGRLLARELGYLYFDTGVMYRAITWVALARGVPIEDEAAITALAGQVRLDVLPPTVADGRDVTVLADGVDITWEIRRPEVEQAVSPVSAYAGVRAALSSQQRRVGQAGRVVMVGRDIGTVVLPDADLKIYLDATPAERARRRYLERRERGQDLTLEEVTADLQRRDEIDSNRQHAPLAAARDAVVVDTTRLSVEEVMERVLGLVKRYAIS